MGSWAEMFRKIEVVSITFRLRPINGQSLILYTEMHPTATMEMVFRNLIIFDWAVWERIEIS